jgi:CCR4-NOT complex subunit CAF16
VDLSLSLPAGSRCLLLGANGSGKSTLLRLLAGKHLVPREAVSVCGGAPFYDTALTTSGQIAYVGGAWTRDVAFAGNDMPLQGDFSAREMLYNVPNVDEARRLRLIEVLDIDLEWRMHQLSDGQRRRVQLAMGLLRPFQALLLDEVTVDLDVVARAELMKYFEEECAERGCTVVYATHIFDGMEQWATHLARVRDGVLVGVDTPEAMGVDMSHRHGLLNAVEGWLRQERDEERAKMAAEGRTRHVAPVRHVADKPVLRSKHMMYYR